MQLTRSEIMEHIKCPEWQAIRVSMKGTTTRHKLLRCKKHLIDQEYSHAAKVQVMNYVNALKRGGQLGMDVSLELEFLGL